MINNVAPEKLVNIYGVQSYTKLYIQHSFNMDTDLLGKAFWVYNASQVQVKEWLVTEPGQLGYTSVTIPGLTQDTPYTVKGQFYDQMIDPELLQAKFGINISDPISLRTKRAPTLTNITVTATQVEVGVSNPTVNFTCQGDADFVEIQYKPVDGTSWSSCYSGQILSPIQLIMPIGNYNFRIRGSIGLPDGVTIEQSQWYQYPQQVNVQYMAIPPSKPLNLTYSVQKIKDGVERYDVRVSWEWDRAAGQQIKQFILEYTTTQKYISSGWGGAQRVNTSSTESQILTNFPFDVEFKVRVLATQWGPNDATMTTQSDVSTLIITKNTPITDNFTKETGVEVGYFGVNQYKGTGAQRVQTFKLDQGTGNLSIGIADAQGKVPFSFDAINNIFNVSGRIITDIINAASFVLTNTSGNSPSFYSQEKPQYGNVNQGIWMGYNSSGKFLFDLGNSSQYVRWDGTSLRIQGNVVIGTPGGDTSLLEALKGKAVVPIYQAQMSTPATPTGTQYPPPGWSTSPPAFNPQTQKVWVSTGTIDPLLNQLISGSSWSTPVQFSGSDGAQGIPGIQGPPGANGANGANGAQGGRGPGIYQNAVVDATTDFNVASANQFFINTFGSQQVIYDCLTQYRISNPQVAWTRMWNGSAWVQPALMVHGDIIANGTIRGEKMVADQAFFQKAGINVIYDRAAQLSANPEGTYKMKIDLASGFIHIR